MLLYTRFEQQMKELARLRAERSQNEAKLQHRIDGKLKSPLLSAVLLEMRLSCLCACDLLVRDHGGGPRTGAVMQQ